MVLGCNPNEVFGSGLPKYTAAESTSGSTVLDYLSINGLLAKIAHTFLSQVILNSKLNIKQKNKHGQQNNLISVLNFYAYPM